MTEQQQHPITPPPELVKKWIEDWAGAQMKGIPSEECMEIAAQAARWGADQELEACCEWMSECTVGCPNELRAVRRPKPPSLKEQALEALSEMEDECLMVTHSATIRRALEALPDD